MKLKIHDIATSPCSATFAQFPPLQEEKRPRVSTAQTAYYLNYVPQTLREQHMRGTYDPRLKPIKVGNKIAWLTDGIRAILEVK
ncbi:DNA-binding protein [Comamonas jiangduensis]|uniref:DNA-binding protein n=1 Tax=Comamonas jiangduensis TaxID=1194168 RepID=UPI003BF7F25A